MQGIDKHELQEPNRQVFQVGLIEISTKSVVTGLGEGSYVHRANSTTE